MEEGYFAGPTDQSRRDATTQDSLLIQLLVSLLCLHSLRFPSLIDLFCLQSRRHSSSSRLAREHSRYRVLDSREPGRFKLWRQVGATEGSPRVDG